MDIGLVESVKKLCENKTGTDIFQYFRNENRVLPFLMYCNAARKKKFYFRFPTGKSYSLYGKNNNNIQFDIINLRCKQCITDIFLHK